MGEYLKEAYLLVELNRNIDLDYQNLCDRYEDLKLSHNRKKRALNYILAFLNTKDACECIPTDIRFALMRKCEDALFCDGRERSKK